MYVKPYINSSRNSLYFNELQIHINYKLISLLQSQFLRYLHSAVTLNSLTWNIRIKTICLWNSFERSSVTTWWRNRILDLICQCRSDKYENLERERWGSKWPVSGRSIRPPASTHFVGRGGYEYFMYYRRCCSVSDYSSRTLSGVCDYSQAPVSLSLSLLSFPRRLAVLYLPRACPLYMDGCSNLAHFLFAQVYFAHIHLRSSKLRTFYLRNFFGNSRIL